MKNINKKKIALMYDFDSTLSTKSMAEFDLFPLLEKDFTFYKDMNEHQEKNNMDRMLCYMYFILKASKEKNIKVTRKFLNEAGKNIELFPGVSTWFKRINRYASRYGLKIEHYIISSGLKELIEKIPIAKYFKRIYACEYHYDDEGVVDWASVAINYTNKTQFIYRINKGALNIYDDDGVNKFVPKEERIIPYENMIYFGDGDTDVPCMKLVKGKGGYSCAVYEDSSVMKAEQLLFEGRINFCAPANYSKYSELDMKIKETIREISKK